MSIQLYFERRADKDGVRRIELQVEEFTVNIGRRYLLTIFKKKGEEQHHDEMLLDDRELALRCAISWFDNLKAEYWPEDHPEKGKETL